MWSFTQTTKTKKSLRFTGMCPLQIFQNSLVPISLGATPQTYTNILYDLKYTNYFAW